MVIVLIGNETLPRLFIRHQALHLAYIRLVRHSGLTQASLALGGLLVQDVGFIGVGADDLSILRKLEALFRAAV